MAAIATILSKIRNVFGEDSFEWLDRSYLVDWYSPYSPSPLSKLNGNDP